MFAVDDVTLRNHLGEKIQVTGTLVDFSQGAYLISLPEMPDKTSEKAIRKMVEAETHKMMVQDENGLSCVFCFAFDCHHDWEIDHVYFYRGVALEGIVSETTDGLVIEHISYAVKMWPKAVSITNMHRFNQTIKNPASIPREEHIVWKDFWLPEERRLSHQPKRAFLFTQKLQSRIYLLSQATTRLSFDEATRLVARKPDIICGEDFYTYIRPYVPSMGGSDVQHSNLIDLYFSPDAWEPYRQTDIQRMVVYLGNTAHLIDFPAEP